MHLESLALTRTLPCLAELGKIMVISNPDRPLAGVIPYLATLPGIIAYNPETCTLTFRRQPGFLTLNLEKVYITQVRDTEEGVELLAALRDTVNATREYRHDLKPATEKKQAPRHLDIFSLIPQANCRKCGETTCLAFAKQLIQHLVRLSHRIVLVVRSYQEGE